MQNQSQSPKWRDFFFFCFDSPLPQISGETLVSALYTSWGLISPSQRKKAAIGLVVLTPSLLFPLRRNKKTSWHIFLLSFSPSGGSFKIDFFLHPPFFTDAICDQTSVFAKVDGKIRTCQCYELCSDAFFSVFSGKWGHAGKYNIRCRLILSVEFPYPCGNASVYVN